MKHINNNLLESDSNKINDYKLLEYPWSCDIWDLINLSDRIYNPKDVQLAGILDFRPIKDENVKGELKVFLYERIKNRINNAGSIEYKFKLFCNLINFLSENYSNRKSISELNESKVEVELRTYLTFKACSKSEIRDTVKFFNYLYEYWSKTYDIREEFDKDIWDVRNINPSKISLSNTKYYLKFTNLPIQYRDLAKRYLKVCLQRYSFGYCERRLYGLRVFLTYINEKHSNWTNLKELNRSDIENFITWAQTWFKSRGCERLDLEIWSALVDLKVFIEYIQLAQYEDAPQKLVSTLIFKEDKPRKPDWKLNMKKYIPQEVLVQLEENMEYLDSAYIPVVLILRATGLRICDVLALKYNKCLELVNDGWYVVADISKTKVMNHRIPITEEVAFIIKQQSEIAEKIFEKGNNPSKFLFVRECGVRAYLPPSTRSLERALNKLSMERNIVDENNSIFHFKNHAFRHTKAVELINNGMNLLHVQKWLAHYSPEMTLRYAQLLDTTLRKSWEQVMKSGIFKVDMNNGQLEKVEICSENSDLIEWEYIRKNLDAVRIPLGYCFKPIKVQCNNQLNPCLTCSNMCTSPEFANEFEIEIEETKRQIERAKQLGRTVWIEKNEAVLERLQVILAVLKEGKIYHKVGKQKREYVGDERNG